MGDVRNHDAPAPRYLLGHSDREIERLKAQARLVDPVTQRFFREAGIAPGMRVLDVGSGAGDVAFLAADIVGASGEVLGVDQNGAALDIARSRAASKSLTNVVFREGDAAAMPFDRAFDAVIGRYVLQFQSDPAAMLESLATHVRPGGIIVFHEIDWSGLGSFPPVPTFDSCCRWGAETLRLHGTETRMGTKLHSTFVGARLAPPTMRLQAPIGGVPLISPWLSLFKELIATILPEMERQGVATAAQVDVETLVERIETEAAKHSSVILGHFQVGAWVQI